MEGHSGILDFRFWILDWKFAGKHVIQNPKSKIQNAWAIIVLFLNFCSASSVFAMEQRKPAPQPSKQFSPSAQQPVNARLVAEHRTVPLSYVSTHIGVFFEIKDGWHIYAEIPGDAGLPTKVVWTVPDWVQLEPVEWPKAKTFVDPGDIRTFGYEKSLLIATRFAVGYAPSSTHEVPIRAKVTWLACKEICLPGSASLSLTIPMDGPQLSNDAHLFEQMDDAHHAQTSL